MTTAQQRKGTNGSDRLIGWLVSYALDSQGKSYEIRAGRSLLSAEEQRAERIITVEENSVSSPHAALSASNKHRVMVQDIFSEHGTYITRSDSDKEIPVSGPIEIEHGDWLRVGDNSRFQVCLIDGPRR